MSKGKLVSSVLALFVISLFFILFASNVSAGERNPMMKDVIESRPPVAGIYGGFGFNDSEGSGSLMADYNVWHGNKWYEKVRLHAHLWTDAKSYGQVETVTTTMTQYTRPITTITNTTIIDDTRGTSNFAVGVAWCPTFGPLFACAGVAYMADDNTANIPQNLVSNLAAGFDVKGWRVFGQHYSCAGTAELRCNENFVMAGKQFSIK